MGKPADSTAPTGERTAIDTMAVRNADAFDLLLTAEAATGPDEREGPRGEPVFDFSDRVARTRPRASALDWTALALSVIVPPVGLVASIAARVASRRATGWTTRVARSATVLSVILTLALGAAYAALVIVHDEAAARAQVAADARPLCAALDETPGVLESPAFDWPTERVAIPQTLEAMKLYRERWTALADVAPAPIARGVASVAGAAQTLVASVESTQVLDRQHNLDQMTAATAASGVTAWYAQHCG